MLDQKYNALEKEAKWLKYWEENKINEFKLDEREIYSIDTPPPTVSGNIHIGHVFSYIQTEIMARYKRLQGYNVFYPFGFDDNGLPTERLVEKEMNILAKNISREDFSKMCLNTALKYEDNYQKLFKRIGISADFNNHLYHTASESTTKISQLSFLDLYKKGNVNYKESPALWCCECQTSIAQAELETASIDSTFNYIEYKTTDGEPFMIATTRPELIPAIVSIFINPNDQKNGKLIGKTAHIPLFDIDVPILSDDKVDMEKGTGIVMCCTFGDQTDIEWWSKYKLPLKKALTNDGYMTDIAKKYTGLKAKEARKAIIEDLTALGLVKKIEKLTHEVQVHERCHNEIEYTITKQWFIDIMNHKTDFLKMGNRIKWHPAFMRKRYEEWVNNILWDWCISRQRYFGVPFPVWYCEHCGNIIVAKEEELPVNPLTHTPKEPCSCGSKNFVPEKDVMDTWATSSVTPLINMKYGESNNLVKELSPMSLRPNAHDIIRTWDFYTIVKSFYHFNDIPWSNIMISGFIMASKGVKVSKRDGNSKVDPMTLMDNYSADVVRFWSSCGRIGTDMLYNEETFERGKKLVNKLWNVSKFVEMHLSDYKDKDFNDYEYIDKWIINEFNNMESLYHNYFSECEIGLAMNVLEKFFWNFCDNYIEIVKHRLYRPEEFSKTARYSGQKTIYTILYKLLQCFSVYFPYITEDIYQEIYHDKLSIHQTIFEPNKIGFNTLEHSNELINLISEVRGVKTNNSVSLKTGVRMLDISINESLENELKEALPDICATLYVKSFKYNIKKIVAYKINIIELEIDK